MSDFKGTYASKINSVLTPLPGPVVKQFGPGGASLLYEDAYRDIQTARLQEDESLPQGVWQRALKKVDWKQGEALCLEALTQHTKDLQIAAWLIEAWTQRDNLEGLKAGITLIKALCETYWDVLHPLPRDQDQEFRLAPFDWIDDKIVLILKLYPITAPGTDREKSYTLIDWIAVTQMVGMTQTASQKLSKRLQQEGGVTLAQFNSSRDTTPVEYYQQVYRHSQEIMDLIQQFNKMMEAKAPKSAGFFFHLRDELKQMAGFAEITLKARGAAVQEHPSLSTKIEKTVATLQQKFFKKEAPMPSSPGSKDKALSLNSREDAYVLLEQVATYLAAVEPHSPTPLLIRRAISWGQMSLAEVLQELIQDKNDLVKIQNLLGLEKK